MIGVISQENEKHIVKEFFQLFKTPWEHYVPQKSYEVVISSTDVHNIDAKLLIIFSSRICKIDSFHGISTKLQDKNGRLKYNNIQFPIYGNLMTFKSDHTPMIQTNDGSVVAGLRIEENNRQILRLGYDLFEEISTLLSTGQPLKNAALPTLDIHISMLREWILKAGIPFVEIPPVPSGYRFFVCLSHDVDFVGIKNHKFDLTMLGFLHRSLFGSLFDLINGRLSWRKAVMKFKAVLKLPAVYLGLAEDFWFQFEQFLKIEKDYRSTFYFIPYKENPGDKNAAKRSKRRAVRYDINDIKDIVKEIADRGYEIGLHGIDAWHDSVKGRQEMMKIHEIVGSSEMGIRMHWLYFDSRSPKILEKTGFIYDSTSGYNEAVGYRAGTTQVFQPVSTKTLLELPLHIMDTALFYGGRMNLSDSEAAALCDQLIEGMDQFGGALTINWHHRSLAPERLWGGFYEALIEKLKMQGAYFNTAMQVVRWFQKRREIFFEEVRFSKYCVTVKFNREDLESNPPLLLRLHLPSENPSINHDVLKSNSYIDVPITNKTEIKITFDGLLDFNSIVTENESSTPGNGINMQRNIKIFDRQQ